MSIKDNFDREAISTISEILCKILSSQEDRREKLNQEFILTVLNQGDEWCYLNIPYAARFQSLSDYSELKIIHPYIPVGNELFMMTPQYVFAPFEAVIFQNKDKTIEVLFEAGTNTKVGERDITEKMKEYYATRNEEAK